MTPDAMGGLALSVDAGWAAGLVLSITRVAAFAVASPMLSRVLPLPGRLAVVLAIGLFLASPVSGALDVPTLIAAGVANSVVGFSLGFLTGLIFQLFPVAGSLVDMTSGLSVAQVVDPTRGEHGAIFSRMTNVTALAVFYVAGGLPLLVRGLALSVEAVPLDGSVAPVGGMAMLAMHLAGRLMLAGAELALPLLAALFVTEVVLGLAARFAPQANVFLLGLPAKVLITLSMASTVLLLFPETMDGALGVMRDTFRDALRGLRP